MLVLRKEEKHYTACRNNAPPSLPRMSIWKVDVNSLLKPSPDSGVQYPGDVGGSQHQDAIVIIAHSLYKTLLLVPIPLSAEGCGCYLHLNQELSLDPPG